MWPNDWHGWVAEIGSSLDGRSTRTATNALKQEKTEPSAEEDKFRSALACEVHSMIVDFDAYKRGRCGHV